MGGHTRWYWGITDFVRCGDSRLVMFARRFLGLDTTGISGLGRSLLWGRPVCCETFSDPVGFYSPEPRSAPPPPPHQL